jgi:uncharacterized protein YyaL (SSP411 family)
MHRPKPLADEAVPSGNGIAALALDTLGHLLGEPRYLEAAGGTVRAAAQALARHPEAHASLLKTLDRQLDPPEIVVVRGARPELAAWQQSIDSGFDPRRLLFFIADDVGDLPGVLASRKAETPTTAYFCKGAECLAPIRDLDELEARLRAG